MATDFTPRASSPTANDSAAYFNSHSRGKMYPPTAHVANPLPSETALPPKLDVNVGAKSYFFQPPIPSAAETLQQSTNLPSSEDATPNTSRKRSRHQYSSSDHATPCSATARGWVAPSGNSTPNVVSPAPFVNTQYRLAGGLDTPTTALATSLELNEGNRPSPNMMLRGGRRGKSRGIQSEDYFGRIPSVLSREANGRPRIYSRHSSKDGWGGTVYTILGAAGKVWEFCKASAFRGFYAGKGPGYALTPPIHPVAEESLQWHDLDEKEYVFDGREGENSVPGRFPEGDFIENYMLQDHSSPARAAKKVRRSKGEGELPENWVMVNRSPMASREGSPVRLSTRKLPASSPSGRRPILRAERRPLISAHRPSLTSHAGSPGMRSDRPASFASSRSPLTSPKRESPVSVEVQRHAARIRRLEIEEDANLKRFNMQLKAMIREGKEALRTTVEVEDESDVVGGEGYVEGDHFAERNKG
ncbi:MAG: hypothetical protein L6R39_002007 [Caloplaca ligustica]|nr:MAG: hypothetical protein L6R39_002007 [Caloplaca ligustica]